MIELAIPILILGLALAISWPLGWYMRWAMEPVHPGLRRLAYERLWHRVLGQVATVDQNWK